MLEKDDRNWADTKKIDILDSSEELEVQNRVVILVHTSSALHTSCTKTQSGRGILE